jgi:hypothetical protein
MLKTKTTLKLISMVMTIAIIFTAADSQAFGGIGKKKPSKTNQQKQSKLWQQIEETDIPAIGERSLLPRESVAFRLNQNGLKSLMQEMPLEFSESAKEKSVIMEIPMPDGKTQQFRIEESELIGSHIKDDFPTWKTFNGYGIDDPTATARFDWTIKGFHGYILTPNGTVYIEPFQDKDTQNYIVFYKHKFGNAPGNFYCSVDGRMQNKMNNEDFDASSLPSSFSNGTQIRRYRVAVATTGEWARATAGGSTDPNTVRTSALAGITTAINRIDGIYRREIGVTLQLVNPSITNEMTNIVYDDPATDPYDNTDTGPQLVINHNTITTRVGTQNFDFGHLFGTGGGGVAAAPSICSVTQKGEGYSSNGTAGPNDPFVVDFAAHEMGHQFGASHTYNALDNGACSTRSTANAFEVASGATIMSYVGACNSQNLQLNNNFATPSFHIRSLTQIFANLVDPNEGGSCGVPLAGANTVPTVSAGTSYTKLLLIYKKDFFRLLEESDEFNAFIMSRMSSLMREIASSMENLAIASPEKRVAKVLLKLAEKEDNIDLIQITLRRQDIAEMAGLTTETTIRVARKLAEKNLIKIIRGKIILENRELLQDFLAS